MPLKHLSLLIASFVLLQCSSSTINETPMKKDKENSKDSCCKQDTAHTQSSIIITSEITCPKCGHKKTETMPTDVCVIKYTCENCKTELTPTLGDCCVFCTYGTHKCPSMQ